MKDPSGAGHALNLLVLAPQPFYVPRGTPIAVRALLQALAAQGHTCDVLVFAEGDDPGLRGVQVFRLPRLPGLQGMPPGFSLKKLVCDMIMVPMAARRLWSGRYDLVIAVEEAAFIALAMKPFFRVPYIYDVDSSIPEQIDDKYGLPRRIRALLDAAEGRAMRGSIGAITCCRALQDLVEGHAPGLPVQTLEDVTLVEGSGEMPEDCRFDEPVVMYIGNLEAYQGVDLLLRGFARSVADGTAARLVIIGGTSDHVAKLEALANELGVGGKVNLLGPRPIERIGDYLSAASIVVSPRTKGRNTPMKVYSYLDSGRPLVATRLRTHTQVLDDEIAMLVEPTPEDMARGLSTLLADPALRHRLAQAAASRVAAEFNPNAFARKLSAFMESQIEPRLATS